MGAGGASTGGGGGVGPAGIKTDGTYGTKKDSKKASSRNELRSFIKGGGVIGSVLKGVSKFGTTSNLKRRKSFISKYNTNVPPSERIDLTDEQISSKEGLANLKDKGYTTASDTMNTGGGNDNNNQPAEPIIVKKNIGGTEVQTTEAKLAEEKEIDDAYDMRKTKRIGRRQTILTSQRGATGNLVLGKPTLLGA